MTVPDEAVEYVFNAYRANVAWEGTEAERWDRFRVALEASGAVFLTDEEREALGVVFQHVSEGALKRIYERGRFDDLRSAREKLA